MKIKLDENISRHLKSILSNKGHEIVTAEDEGLLGKADSELGNAAKAEGRMLFTLDLEFANLHRFPPGSHPGVVLFRPQAMGPLTVNRFIAQFVEGTDLDSFSGCLVIVDPMKVRIRRP